MKYSIRQNHLNKTMLFEDGIQVGKPNAPELEFWARIQELESYIKEENGVVKDLIEKVELYLPKETKIQELEDSLKFWKNETKNQDAAIFSADKRIQELELAIKDRDERIAAATRVIGSSLEKLKEY